MKRWNCVVWVVLAGTCAAAACDRKADREAAQAASVAAPDSGDYIVKLPSGGTLRVPSGPWKPMTNEYAWADNFEQRIKDPRHEFPRVVTIFKLPMTDDRRLGVRISPNEYVEMFVAHPGRITVHVRVDKKSYWVMSRETFAATAIHGVDTSPYHTFYDEELKLVMQQLVVELDRTRYLLQSSF